MSFQLWPSLYPERLPPTNFTPMPSGAEDHSVQQWQCLAPRALVFQDSDERGRGGTGVHGVHATPWSVQNLRKPEDHKNMDATSCKWLQGGTEEMRIQEGHRIAVSQNEVKQRHIQIPRSWSWGWEGTSLCSPRRRRHRRVKGHP